MDNITTDLGCPAVGASGSSSGSPRRDRVVPPHRRPVPRPIAQRLGEAASGGSTIFVPWFGALIYIIVRGRSMTERQMAEMAQVQAQQEQYIKQVAASSAAASPADQIASAKSLLDSGAITPSEFEDLKAKALA